MVDVDLKGKTVFVTGAAGFIGSNLVLRLFNDINDITHIVNKNYNFRYLIYLFNKEFSININDYFNTNYTSCYIMFYRLFN